MIFHRQFLRDVIEVSERKRAFRRIAMTATWMTESSILSKMPESHLPGRRHPVYCSVHMKLIGFMHGLEKKRIVSQSKRTSDLPHPTLLERQQLHQQHPPLPHPAASPNQMIGSIARPALTPSSCRCPRRSFDSRT